MENSRVIAIASGKGGTGKTTLATNLAMTLSASGQPVQYIDCDVEEPNGHIFLKPAITERSDVTVLVPAVDSNACIRCGRCGQICQFNAIVCLGREILTFEQLCHSCGGCWRICPVDAIRTRALQIGEIESGNNGAIKYLGGILKIGHVRTPTLIGELKKHIEPGRVTILDVPPGTSCPVVAAIRGVDFVLLVTEPTPFGLHDLTLAVELVREMGLPFAVAVNRDGLGDNRVEQYCAGQNIDIVLRLPDDRRIAEAYSVGKLLIEAFPEYRRAFSELAQWLGVD